MKVIICLYFSLFFYLNSYASFTLDTALVEGENFYQKSESSRARKLQAGQRFTKPVKIITHQNGFVRLLLNKMSIIELGPNSIFELKSGDKKASVHLISGTFKVRLFDPQKSMQWYLAQFEVIAVKAHFFSNIHNASLSVIEGQLELMVESKKINLSAPLEFNLSSKETTPISTEKITSINQDFQKLQNSYFNQHIFKGNRQFRVSEKMQRHLDETPETPPYFEETEEGLRFDRSLKAKTDVKEGHKQANGQRDAQNMTQFQSGQIAPGKTLSPEFHKKNTLDFRIRQRRSN